MLHRSDLLSCAVALAGICLCSPAFGSGFAVVEANGTLVRGTALNASRTGPGAYAVLFNHSVRYCAYTATTGSTSGGTPPNGFATVAGSSENRDVVVVTTYDPAGNAANFAFHLNLRC
jgi:hypothetical protein